MTTSEKCGPVTIIDRITAQGDVSPNVTHAELSASAFLLQDIKFLDGNLTSTHSGFPRKVNKSICIKCLEGKKNSSLSGCSIVDGKTYQPGSLLIHVETTQNAFGTITNAFQPSGSKKPYNGLGDVTRNGNICSAFLFYPETVENQLQLTYFEYAHQKHCLSLVQTARDRANCTNGDSNCTATNEMQSPVVIEKTKALVRTYVIRCAKSDLSINNFNRALQVYRTMQLENTISLAGYNRTEMQFQKITLDDVYRAALSMKIIDDEHEVGPYQVYTECGDFDWTYLIPFMLSLAMISALGLYSIIISWREGHIEIPYNSDSWFEEIRNRDEIVRINRSYFHQQPQQQQQQQEQGQEQRRPSRRRRRYFSFTFDELVLVGDRENGTVRIDSQRRDMDNGVIFEEIGAGPVYLASTAGSYHSQWPGSLPPPCPPPPVPMPESFS